MSITSRNKVYGSRSENMWLVRTLKFEWMNVLQNVFYWKRMANVLNRPGGRKHILVSTFVVRMQRVHFCLRWRFYVLLAVECLRMIKLNKTIISVLVYADRIKASLYLYPLFRKKNREYLFRTKVGPSSVRPSVHLSVCLSVCLSVRPSVTILVIVCSPKPLDVATSNCVGA